MNALGPLAFSSRSARRLVEDRRCAGSVEATLLRPLLPFCTVSEGSCRTTKRPWASSAMKASFRHPDFLTPADEPTHRVRCPIHGFIRFSENERKIIDHWLFRRLRWIRQLALTELLSPGATHTRFEHSLGVMDVATRIFDALARSNGAVMESTFARWSSSRTGRWRR